MSVFLKVTAGVLIALVLYLMLIRQGKEVSLVLTICVCTMVSVAALQYLEPVVDFFQNLQITGELDSSMVSILLKAVGISLLSELTAKICADAGNSALGKTLEIAASAALLWISIPVFTKLLKLVGEILEAV